MARVSAASLKRMELERQVMNLKRGGASNQQIGNSLHISRVKVWRILQRVYARYAKECGDDYFAHRAVHLDRLESYILQASGILNGKDTPPVLKLQALDRLTKLLAQQSTLLGLDATMQPPTEVDPNKNRNDVRAKMLPLMELMTLEDKIAMSDLMRKAIARRPVPVPELPQIELPLLEGPSASADLEDK